MVISFSFQAHLPVKLKLKEMFVPSAKKHLRMKITDTSASSSGKVLMQSMNPVKDEVVMMWLHG